METQTHDGFVVVNMEHADDEKNKLLVNESEGSAKFQKKLEEKQIEQDDQHGRDQSGSKCSHPGHVMCECSGSGVPREQETIMVREHEEMDTDPPTHDNEPPIAGQSLDQQDSQNPGSLPMQDRMQGNGQLNAWDTGRAPGPPRLQEESAESEEARAKLLDDIKAYQNMNQMLQSYIKDSEEKIERMAYVNKTVQEENERLRSAIDAFKNTNESLIAENATNVENIQRLQEGIILHQRTNEWYQNQCKELTNEIRSKEEMLKKRDITINELAKKFSDEESRCQNLKKQHENKLKQLDNKLAKAQESNKNLQKKIEGLENGHKRILRDHQTEIKKIKNDYGLRFADEQAVWKATELSLKEEIKRQKEVHNALLMRYSKLAGETLAVGNPNVTDLSDPDRPTRLAEQFSELYDNEWTDAFEELPAEFDEKKINVLLTILQRAYDLSMDITATDWLRQYCYTAFEKHTVTHCGTSTCDSESGKISDRTDNFEAGLQDTVDDSLSSKDYASNIDKSESRNAEMQYLATQLQKSGSERQGMPDQFQDTDSVRQDIADKSKTPEAEGQDKTYKKESAEEENHDIGGESEQSETVRQIANETENSGNQKHETSNATENPDTETRDTTDDTAGKGENPERRKHGLPNYSDNLFQDPCSEKQDMPDQFHDPGSGRLNLTDKAKTPAAQGQDKANKNEIPREKGHKIDGESKHPDKERQMANETGNSENQKHQTSNATEIPDTKTHDKTNDTAGKGNNTETRKRGMPNDSNNLFQDPCSERQETLQDPGLERQVLLDKTNTPEAEEKGIVYKKARPEKQENDMGGESEHSETERQKINVTGIAGNRTLEEADATENRDTKMTDNASESGNPETRKQDKFGDSDDQFQDHGSERQDIPDKTQRLDAERRDLANNNEHSEEDEHDMGGENTGTRTQNALDKLKNDESEMQNMDVCKSTDSGVEVCSKETEERTRKQLRWIEVTLPKATLNEAEQAAVRILPHIKKKILTADFTIQSVIRQCLEQEFNLKEETPVYRYAVKCCELCLLMCLKDPPVYIDFQKKDDNTAKALFNDGSGEKYKAYTKKGKYVAYIVWPCLYLHKDGPLLSKGIAQGEN